MLTFVVKNWENRNVAGLAAAQASILKYPMIKCQDLGHICNTVTLLCAEDNAELYENVMTLHCSRKPFLFYPKIYI